MLREITCPFDLNTTSSSTCNINDICIKAQYRIDDNFECDDTNQQAEVDFPNKDDIVVEKHQEHQFEPVSLTLSTQASSVYKPDAQLRPCEKCQQLTRKVRKLQKQNSYYRTRNKHLQACLKTFKNVSLYHSI